MLVATCLSAYGLILGYLLIGYAALLNKWQTLKIPIAVFIGVKLNALTFYHVMEFTSDIPPPDLIPYFSVEGPYLLAIALVLYRLSGKHLKVA